MSYLRLCSSNYRRRPDNGQNIGHRVGNIVLHIDDRVEYNPSTEHGSDALEVERRFFQELNSVRLLRLQRRHVEIGVEILFEYRVADADVHVEADVGGAH